MNVRQATTQYEAWLAAQIPLLKEDLKLKHQRMREDPFFFLRATFYRWAQVWVEACGKLASGPVVLSVGDLHVENFGTWRDKEGRLVWGVNDYDETHPMPYTNDLIRLATSALLAHKELNTPAKRASEEILRGYDESLKAGGKAFVLVDHDTPLREMVIHRLKQPERFWEKFTRLVPLKSPVKRDVLDAVRSILPAENIRLRFGHRIAGLGSLGRERFTGVGVWEGGSIAREAKAWAPSACFFARGGKTGPLFITDILNRAIRAHDPYWKIQGRWNVRRLSPDCFRLELTHLPKERDELKLLYAMGWETANIHLGSGKGAEIRKNLRQKPAHWLYKSALAMEEQTQEDWGDWR
ncbi:MAG TPA: DUF2252 family protein [Verrucomicrobiae bacterium]|nr:DUF2252 family protein [Verrucomicrobiae bacterium]